METMEDVEGHKLDGTRGTFLGKSLFSHTPATAATDNSIDSSHDSQRPRASIKRHP